MMVNVRGPGIDAQVLFVRTFVRGQEDVCFILTSLDGAEEPRPLRFVPNSRRRKKTDFFCDAWFGVRQIVRARLSLRVRVFLSGRQQEMAERIRCICGLRLFKSVIPVSSV